MKKLSMKAVALLMLVCMLVPFTPSLVALFATEAKAASSQDNIIVYDDFQKGTSADYASTHQNYTATLESGQLIVSTMDATGINTNGAYLFPYDGITDASLTEITISFEFTILRTSANMPSLWVAYGASSTDAYALAGLRVNDGREFAGCRNMTTETETVVSNGVTTTQQVAAGTDVYCRDHYLKEGQSTTYEYLLAGTHTMTVQATKGQKARVYIDGLRYLNGGSEGWYVGYDSTAASADANAIVGKFGIDLWKSGMAVAIDNFLVYEGHGALTTTPTSTIGAPAGVKEVILRDDFSDPYAYDYYDAASTWGKGNTSSFDAERGALILDGTNGGNWYSDYYPLPHKVPENVSSYTVELEFSVLAYENSTTETASWGTYEHHFRTDIMLAYGISGTTDDRVYVNGLRIGDRNQSQKAGPYLYDRACTEFWGVIGRNSSTGQQNFGRLYRSAGAASSTLGSGFALEKTYTLVVQINEGDAFCFIKEVAYTTARNTWASRDALGNVDSGWLASDWNDKSPVDDHSEYTGYLGIYCGGGGKIAVESVTVYDGIYTPNVVTASGTLYDDFLNTGANDYSKLYNYTNDENEKIVTSHIIAGGDTKGHLQVIRNSPTVTCNKLPHMTLPVGTTSFTAEAEFSLGSIGTSGNIDIMLAFGSHSGGGYWAAGFRIKEGGVTEQIIANNATNAQQGRCYRDASTTFGWGNMTQGSTYKLRVEVTEGAVRSSLIVGSTTYQCSYAVNDWRWDNSSFDPQYTTTASSTTPTPGTASATTTQTLYLNTQMGGTLGFYTHEGFGGYSVINYQNLRVDYTAQKEVLPDGTLLFYEDFSGIDAASIYNKSDTNATGTMTGTVQNGALKISGGGAYLFPGAVLSDNITSFTAEIDFRLDTLPAANGTNYGGEPCTDFMLFYGAKSVKHGFISGFSSANTTEFLGSYYGTVKRAFRAQSAADSTTLKSLGWPAGTEREAPVVGKTYTLVVRVQNGTVSVGFKGYASYSVGNTDYYSSDINLSSNSYVATTTTNGQSVTKFANSLAGGLGIFNRFNREIVVERVSVVSGLSVVTEIPDTKTIADGTVLYQNNFNDAVPSDYPTPNDYISSTIVDGALSLEQKKDGAIMYTLPNSTISGVKSMTITFDFLAEDVQIADSSIMLGYASSKSNSFSYCGWRQTGSSYNWLAEEYYGTAIDGTIGTRQYSRTWLKRVNKLSAKDTIGTKAEYDADPNNTQAKNYTENYEFLQDGNWHQMKIVITTEKAIMFIDGQRTMYQVTNEGAFASASANFGYEAWNGSANMIENICLQDGSLGIYMYAAGTKIRVDNVLAVAGTLDCTNGNISFEEAYAGQGTLNTDQINGVRDNTYDRGSALTTDYTYASVANSNGLATGETRVLWDGKYLYLHTTVTDATANATGDSVRFYISEGESLSYQTGMDAYAITVYRNGNYSISNPSAASGVYLSVQNDVSGYIVEAKIPLLGEGANRVALGDSIGFNYIVTDANTSGVQLGWRSWTPGHGRFGSFPDNLDHLTLALSASPTGDGTDIWAYLLVGGMALVGALSATWLMLRRKRKA